MMCMFINVLYAVGPNCLEPTRYTWASTQKEAMSRRNKRETWRNWCWDPMEPTSLCSNFRGEDWTHLPTSSSTNNYNDTDYSF